MPRMFKSSTAMTSNRRARSVEVFSTQSLRRSASRALSRAMAALTRARRLDPRSARARRRSNRRHPHLTRAARQPPHLPGTAAGPHDPEPLMHPGLTPGGAAVRTGEEVRHRLREVPERLLLHRLRTRRQPRVGGAGLGELAGLRAIPRRRAAPRRPPGVLFNGQVPDVPGVRAMLQQPRLLGRGRTQPVPRHASQPTDHHRQNPDRRNQEAEVPHRAAFPPRPQGRGLHAVGIR